MKSAASRHRKPKFDPIDFASLFLAYLIIAQLVSAVIAIQVNFRPLSKIDSSITSVNHVVYLLRGSGGNLSDALTADQVVARFKAVEEDPCTLTIHSILTTPVDPGRMFLPCAAASKASDSFWQTESSAIRHQSAVAG